MKCEFCGGVVSWVGSLIDNPSTKCAGCGRANCQEVEPLPDEEVDDGGPYNGLADADGVGVTGYQPFPCEPPMDGSKP